MSAILFHTTPRGDLPHYAYIFRKAYPLGKDMNNLACSRLGKMLHLDIQKGKEATNTFIFQKYFGDNAACMKRLMMAKKGCGQLTSNDTYFYDIWFSGVNMGEEAMAVGVGFGGPAKMSHKVF